MGVEITLEDHEVNEEVFVESHTEDTDDINAIPLGPIATPGNVPVEGLYLTQVVPVVDTNTLPVSHDAM